MKILSLILCLLILSAAVSAQKTAVPIVELKIKGLLGGAENGRWLTPVQIAAKMKAKTEFALIGPRGAEEGGVAFGSRAEIEDVCQDFYRINLELNQEAGVAIGSNGGWSPVPRVPQAIPIGNQTYRAAVANFLKKKGIVKPTVKITQIYRIDLEGDGSEEVIIAATFYKNGLSSNAKVGDYSFVMVRKAVGGMVAEYLLAGDFIKKNIDFGAPSQHEISALADLNGDGRMEIVLYGQYYEGEFASAFEMKAGKPAEIKEFSIGCGV